MHFSNAPPASAPAGHRSVRSRRAGPPRLYAFLTTDSGGGRGVLSTLLMRHAFLRRCEQILRCLQRSSQQHRNRSFCRRRWPPSLVETGEVEVVRESLLSLRALAKLKKANPSFARAQRFGLFWLGRASGRGSRANLSSRPFGALGDLGYPVT
jgi:hypothetical protein